MKTEPAPGCEALVSPTTLTVPKGGAVASGLLTSHLIAILMFIIASDYNIQFLTELHYMASFTTGVESAAKKRRRLELHGLTRWNGNGNKEKGARTAQHEGKKAKGTAQRGTFSGRTLPETGRTQEL